MLIPLALMAAGVSQYRKYKNDQAEEIDRAADREYKSSVRNYEAGQRERTTRLQKEQDEFAVSMKNAAKPAVVEPVDIPAEGPVQPGAEAPMKQGYSVNGKVVGNEAARDKAVAEYSAPDAVMARMADAQLAAGRPDLAMETRQKSAQAKLTGLQLDDAQRTALNRAYDDDLNKKATTFDALGEFITGSKGDGQGGAIKVKPVPSADSKQITFNTIGDDGSMTPTPYTFENSPAGLLRAKSLLSRSTTLENKLVHLHQQKQEEQAAAQLAETGRANRVGEAQRAQTIGLEATRVGLAKAAAAADAKLPLAVKTQVASYDKELNNISAAMAKAQADGSFNEASPGAQALMLRQKVLVAKTEELLKPYLGGGKPADGGKNTDALGLFVDKPADRPATKGAEVTNGAASTKPEGPGFLARMADSPIVKRVSELGTDYTSEAGKAALTKRVAEAGQGGAPLTDVEKLRAKQAGLI